jgi:hypothetical protein
MWFREIASANHPGQRELVQFLVGFESFLVFVFENRNDFAFLWAEEPALAGLATESFQEDVRPELENLRRITLELRNDVLAPHGLLGRPLRFKIRVLNSVANQWQKIQQQTSLGSVRRLLSASEWFKKIIDAIDALLASLIDAAGGAGGLIKEFKDALRALA